MFWKRQKRKYLCVICILMSVFVFAGCEESEHSSAEVIELEEVTEAKDVTEESEEVDVQPEVLYVYVCGQVRNPGVYKLEQGNRVTHALMAAGGMTDQAAPDYLNQAELLEDGQKLYVPTTEEVLALPNDEADAERSDGRINLNTADKASLTTLSGIGEARAEAIIAYREANGGFQSVEDIMNVEGIKEGIFNRIKDQIKVE